MGRDTSPPGPDSKSLNRRQYLSLAAVAASLSVAGCSQSESTQITDTARTATATPEPTRTSTATESPDHRVRRDVMVEMRDGVTLATDVHLPQEGESFPTLVHRTPYNKAEDVPVGTIPTAVENGYAVVQQDVRGRFASNGWFVPFSEGEDGYDTIEWVAEQSWSTDQVGMYGTSYRGMTTIQAMKEEPPSLVAAAPLVTPANFYHDLQYSGGANNLGTSMAWTASNSFSQISRLNVSESEANALREQLQALFQNWPDSAAQLPEIDISAFDQGVAPYWRDWLEHPTFDNYWQAIDVLAEVGDLSIPMVQAGGWYDIFLDGTTSLFSAVEERAPEVVRENQRLVIGPWSHLTYPSADPVGDRDFGSEAAYDLSGELVFPWFDYWLKDEGDGVRSLPKVQYFQMGADEWRSADEWPPSSSTPTDYYLDGDIPDDGVSSGGLSTNEPAAEDATDSYDYDPLDPVPTRGGPLHMGPLQTAGVVDQTPVEERDDVLVYTSEALSESVAIAGDVEATLFVETTAPDTDFVARLVDVGPDGYSMNVTEGVLRARYRESFEEPEFLEAGVVYELTVNLRPVAHTFESGHRIRLDVTSSNFPKLDRNPNTAITVSRATEDDMQTATQTLHRSSNYPSRLQLPVDSA